MKRQRGPVLGNPEAVSLRNININVLPDLPFGTLFEWLPLVDLLSAQLVCHQWAEVAVREASLHRDSIVLCIDGQAEDQKTARYLERTVWNLPHKETLKSDTGRALFPDYVPPTRRCTWNSILLGTRLENPVHLDGTAGTAQEYRQWQEEYDRSFACSLDRQVSLLLSLFPRGGPRTLIIVCRSQHSDCLRLLPLLTSWKDSLVSLSLFSSHPRAFATKEAGGHFRSSLLNHTSNRPLLLALNSLSSLRYLTLDLLGEEGDTLNDGRFSFKLPNELIISGECTLVIPFTFLGRLKSFTFADGNSGFAVNIWLRTSNFQTAYDNSGDSPLRSVQVGNCARLGPGESLATTDWPNHGYSLRHLRLHLYTDDLPLEAPDGEGPFSSLTSCFLNLSECVSLYFPVLLPFLGSFVKLLHLRLHLTGGQLNRWHDEAAASLPDDVQRPPLVRLRVLSLILVDNQPIDHRLPSLFQRIFPYLQVIVLTQRLIMAAHQSPQPTQFLEPYLTSIGRHFSDTLPPASSLLLLEARLYHYSDETRLNLLQSKERTWTVEELRSAFP